jgi:hypothetical protein
MTDAQAKCLAVAVKQSHGTRLHIDFANSITIGRKKEHYYLIFMVDNIDFT